MHKVHTKNLAPGAVLGKTIYSDKGDVLLARGVALTSRYIQAMLDRGYASAYVMDSIADDVEPRGLISDQLRASAVASVRSIYAVREAPFEREFANLSATADAILSELLDKASLAGMALLKSDRPYEYEHPVDVATYSTLLGRRVGLAPALLKEAALGCLLLDIGTQQVDRSILDKPGKLNAAEFELVKQHSLLGFQLARQMPISSPRPANVVLQHHERQDGSGYPNRLFGSNRVGRTDQERFDPRRISLLAEIAAVADTYAALAADRPFRPALPANRIFSIMRSAAGKHLNAELVNAFVTFVQHFAIGSRVRVSSGVHRGCLGVVVRASTNAPTSPCIRLMFDATGRSLGAGREIDLSAQPAAVELQVLPEIEITLEELARVPQAS
jgi:HD-GYP domain-containing protein (c-di-GMP phosphodiesterase class II)